MVSAARSTSMRRSFSPRSSSRSDEGTFGRENAPHLAGGRVDAGEVDASEESNLGRNVGVLRAAADRKRVDAVLVDGLRGAERPSARYADS